MERGEESRKGGRGRGVGKGKRAGKGKRVKEREVIKDKEGWEKVRLRNGPKEERRGRGAKGGRIPSFSFATSFSS